MGKTEPGGTEAPPSLSERRSFSTLPLAQLLPGVTRVAFRKRSPASALVLSDWLAIVGPALAGQTEPRKLQRGVLTIACAGPVALELQHLEQALIGRINTVAGPGTVTRLRLIQDTAKRLARPPPPRAATAAVAPSPPELEALGSGPLRDALHSLFEAIKARR